MRAFTELLKSIPYTLSWCKSFFLACCSKNACPDLCSHPHRHPAHRGFSAFSAAKHYSDSELHLQGAREIISFAFVALFLRYLYILARYFCVSHRMSVSPFHIVTSPRTNLKWVDCGRGASRFQFGFITFASLPGTTSYPTEPQAPHQLSVPSGSQKLMAN